MPTLQPWPVLTLLLEGGPDDGDERLVPAAVSPRVWCESGIEDEWGESAPDEWLLERHGLSPERIAGRVRMALGGDTSIPA